MVRVSSSWIHLVGCIATQCHENQDQTWSLRINMFWTLLMCGCQKSRWLQARKVIIMILRKQNSYFQTQWFPQKDNCLYSKTMNWCICKHPAFGLHRKMQHRGSCPRLAKIIPLKLNMCDHRPQNYEPLFCLVLSGYVTSHAACEDDVHPNWGKTALHSVT
jgi:hypothetical protein